MSNEVIIITGARGVGKTTLAGTYVGPTQEALDGLFVHDAENSFNRIVHEHQRLGLRIGYYGNLKERFGNLPSDDDLLSRINAGNLPWVDNRTRSSLSAYYQHILDDLNRNLVPGKYQVYVHDTIEKLEAGMAAWVDENKRGAGVTTTAHGRMWTEGVFPLYEHLLESIFQRGVETIILSSHLRTPWEDNRPVVGKVEPSGKKILYRLSSLFLWLVKEAANADGAPAGLVLKERQGRLEVIDGEWQMRRMIPERIPHCTWKDIRRYQESGYDAVNPRDGERMSPSELDMISELLTDEQMRLMVLGAQEKVLQLQQQQATGTLFPEQGTFTPKIVNTGDTLLDKVYALSRDGKSVEEIAGELGKPVPVINAVLEQAKVRLQDLVEGGA